MLNNIYTPHILLYLFNQLLKIKKWCWEVLLRTYDRLIAEFLQELSLVHLGALTPTYLCRFPVRVLYWLTLRDFSRKQARLDLSVLRLIFSLPLKLSYGFTYKTFSSKERKSNNPPKLHCFVIPSESIKEGWNINQLSIPSTFSGTRLGPPNPWLMSIAKETLGFRWSDISSDLRLLIPTFSLLSAPPFLTKELQREENAPLP